MKVIKKAEYDLLGLTEVEVMAVMVALVKIHNDRRNFLDATVEGCDRVHAALREFIN